MHPILSPLHDVYQQVGSISPPPVDAPPADHVAHFQLLVQLNQSAGEFLEHIVQGMRDADMEPNTDQFGAGLLSLFFKDSDLFQ